MQIAEMVAKSVASQAPTATGDDWDINDAEGNTSVGKLPVGVFEATILSCTSERSTRKDLPPCGLYTVTFTIDRVINQSPDILQPWEDRAPPAPVTEGEQRRWVGKQTEERDRARVRDIMQSALGYVPNSPAVKALGQDWNAVAKEAAGPQNALQGKRLLITNGYAVAKKGHTYAKPSFGPLK